jgi:hypothetical protein
MFVGTDRAGSATLDPPGNISADDRLTVLVYHPAVVVGDDSAPLVERQARQRPASKTHGAQNQRCVDLLGSVRRHGLDRAVDLDELVGGDPQSLNAFNTENFERRDAIPEHDALVFLLYIFMRELLCELDLQRQRWC